jgi:hypothetical protein
MAATIKQSYSRVFLQSQVFSLILCHAKMATEPFNFRSRATTGVSRDAIDTIRIAGERHDLRFVRLEDMMILFVNTSSNSPRTLPETQKRLWELHERYTQESKYGPSQDPACSFLCLATYLTCSFSSVSSPLFLASFHPPHPHLLVV